MFGAIVLLFVCMVLAILHTYSSKKEYCTVDANLYGATPDLSVPFIILLIVMVLFSGLRTQMNDTIAYTREFLNNASVTAGWRNVLPKTWGFSEHPLFTAFQRLVKIVFGSNSQWFIMCHAIVVVSSYLLFLKKYSRNFAWSLFTLIAFTVYAFSMAAMKQVMSIAIGIWAVPALIQKKYIKSIIITLVAMMFHQYAFILLAFAMLNDGVWNKKNWIVIAVSLGFFFTFSQFANSANDIAAWLGKEYEYENLTSAGVGIARVISYAVVPILSFVCRKQINEEHDPMINVAVNSSLASFCFMLISFNGGAVLLGRIPGYFNVLTCVAAPVVLENQKKEYRGIIKVGFVIFMLVFYYTYYKGYTDSYCHGDWFGDIYNHASISSLF